MYVSSASRKLLLLILFYLPVVTISAQNACGCDEAVALRQPMGAHFNSGNLDSATFYTKKLLQFKEEGCKIFFQDWMAQISLAKKDYVQARIYLDTEKKMLRQSGCGPDMYVRHYSTLAKLYQELNLFDSVVIACLSGIEVSEQAKDFYGLSRANTDLAAAFGQMGQKDNAIYYYRKGLDAAKKQTKSPTQTALVQTRLGALYLNELELSGNKRYADSAFSILKEALDTAGKYHDLFAYLEANEELAKHANLTGNFIEAIRFSEEIIRSTPAGAHLFDRFSYAGYSRKSDALFGLKDFVAAEKYADTSLIYATQFNPQMMVGAYKRIYEAAKANKNAVKSLDAHEKMVALKDSLFSLEKNKAISELEKKYNQAKNEKTIGELAQQKRIYLLLAIAGLLGLTALAFFLRQQTLKSRQRILETEQRLNRARMNPHFFFNALASLQSFALQENDGKSIAGNLARFSHIMRETLESTYKEYITIEAETGFLTEYLEIQKMRFPQKFIYTINTSVDIEPGEMLIPSMILQPFIENSIEHGFAGITYQGHIVLDFKKQNSNLIIMITDNGRGLQSNTKDTGEHISRASQIIRDRIFLLNSKLNSRAEFSVSNNTEAQGVIVRISLPVLFKEDIKD